MSKKNGDQTYQEHLQRIKSCSHSWRILEKRPFNQQLATEDIPKYRVVPVRCKSKSCKYCLSKEVSKIRNKLQNSPFLSKLRFFTLTSLNDNKTDIEKIKKLVSDFRKLTLHFRKNYKSFSYFYILERSKSGMWHIHGFWNIYIPLKELSQTWSKISGAYRCDLQKIKSKRGCINYVANYLTKSGINHPEKITFYDSNKRQYNSSRGFFEKENYIPNYILYSNEIYSTEELKKELVKIFDEYKLFSGDISFENYPYQEDLICHIQETVWLE